MKATAKISAPQAMVSCGIHSGVASLPVEMIYCVTDLAHKNYIKTFYVLVKNLWNKVVK